MDFRVSISPSARQDLHDLVSYIAADNPPAAEQFGLRILNEVERTAVMPEIGRVVPEFGIPDLRELIVRPYRIVYRIDKRRSLIEIVRIWHAARGIPDIQEPKQ